MEILNEQERQAFLFFANGVIEADGKIDDSEMQLLNTLLSSLNILTKESGLNEDESFNIMKAASEKVKKAAYLELYSLAVSDGDYDPKEKAYLKKIQQQLNLTSDFVEKAAEWLQNYYTEIKKGMKLIVNEE